MWAASKLAFQASGSSYKVAASSFGSIGVLRQSRRMVVFHACCARPEANLSWFADHYPRLLAQHDRLRFRSSRTSMT